MCFSPQVSFAFSVAGLLVAALLRRKFPRHLALTWGTLYFVLMEVLQFGQYLILDTYDCSSWTNKILTSIGFVHIAFQPAVIHAMGRTFAHNDAEKAKADVFVHLALLGGVALLVNGLMAHSISYTDVQKACLADPVINHDWIRSSFGPCTTRGSWHLAWSAKMMAPSYFMPNSFIHMFVMFAPYFVSGWRGIKNGIIFFLTGPVLSLLFTDSVNEQAAVWCYFSIAQITLLTGKLLLPRHLTGYNPISKNKSP